MAPTDPQRPGSPVPRADTTITDGVLRMMRYAKFADAQSLREEWDALVERVDGDLFTSFDWCATWWGHFGAGRQLELHVGSVGDALAAIFPLFRETIRWGPLSLRVIRVLGCDHGVTTCNVAVDPAWMEDAPRKLLAALEQGGPWDLLHLGELPGYAPHAKPLADALARCPQVGEVTFSNDDYPHMVFDLPESYDNYLAGLSVKERRNVRRDERQLQQTGGVEGRGPADRTDLGRAIDELIAVHGELWRARGRMGHFVDWPGIERFHRDMAGLLLKRGRLALVDVRADGALLAAEYGARFGRRVHWIIGARRPEVTSRIGFCALLRAAIRNGVRQIDALPGSYDYKRRLGATVLGVKTISVLPRRRLARTRRDLFRAATRLGSLLYHRLWFWHLAPWIRLRMPSLRWSWLHRGLWRRFIRARFLVAARHSSDGGNGAVGDSG